ncbi:hypothetical protein IWQ62_001330 [Dispira parvispora]|uniref:Uncharacterized protein n=1 Tax=Dispira parvispora TaxID=1520584 RepID=A0A9W8E8A7_9FUNG|nr:hypothetical protein IWQ62_001330 [Dispira parvispora]
MFSFSKNGSSGSDPQGTGGITSFQSFLQHLPKSTNAGNRAENSEPARPKLLLVPSSRTDQPSHGLIQGGFSFGGRSEWLPLGPLHPAETPGESNEDNNSQIPFTTLLGSSLLQSNTSLPTHPASPVTLSTSNTPGHDHPVSDPCQPPPTLTPGPQTDVPSSTLVERVPTPPITPQKNVEVSTEQVSLPYKEGSPTCILEPCANKLSGEEPNDTCPEKPSGGLSRTTSRTLLVAKTALVEKIRQLNGLTLAFGGNKSSGVNTNVTKPLEIPAEPTVEHHPLRRNSIHKPPPLESQSSLVIQNTPSETQEATSTTVAIPLGSVTSAGSDQPMTELTNTFDHQAMVIQLLQDWKIKEVTKDRRITELESEVKQYSKKENKYKDQLNQAKDRTDKVVLTLEAAEVRCVANETSVAEMKGRIEGYEEQLQTLTYRLDSLTKCNEEISKELEASRAALETHDKCNSILTESNLRADHCEEKLAEALSTVVKKETELASRRERVQILEKETVRLERRTDELARQLQEIREKREEMKRHTISQTERLAERFEKLNAAITHCTHAHHRQLGVLASSLKWLEHQQCRVIMRLGQQGQRLISETQTTKTQLRELCFRIYSLYHEVLARTPGAILPVTEKPFIAYNTR